MLEILNRRFKLGVRFVYQSDATKGLFRSDFSKIHRDERVALLFEGHVLKYGENKSGTIGTDYGVLLRAHPSIRDPRLWIAFAGCGRPASVASRLLVFEPGSQQLWKRLQAGGPLGQFLAIFKVRYSPRDNTRPIVVDVRHIARLD
jgi:hypothetical protein